MLNEFTTIELQGAHFTTSQKLALLSQDGKPTKSTIIYGRNGSGKSTIAKAFKRIKGEDVPPIQIASCYDVNNSIVTLTPDEQQHIFVFDEDYVFNNVRVQEDGLGSIVMLGEQVGLSELISKATEEFKEAESDCNLKRTTADEYKNEYNSKSPKYYIKSIKSVLKGDNSWAGRDKRIKGNVANSSVSDSTYKSFISLSPTKSRDELIVEFESEYKKLEESQSGAAKITAVIPSIPDSIKRFDAVFGNKLLQQVIEQPELSEREQYLLGLVQKAKGEELRQTAEDFEDSTLNICPKCYQPLSDDYKKNLIASIHKVLSEEVKNHQKQLDKMLIPEVEMDILAFQELDHYHSCINGIKNVNEIILNNNRLINSKKEDPFTPIKEEVKSLEEALATLTTALHNLDSDRNAYNNTVSDTKPIKEALTKINNEIAYFDVIDLFKKLDKMTAEKEKADKEYEESQNNFDDKKRKLEELNARRNSINIAIDVINDGLKYIFFSDTRMKIQVENGTYKLICNGQSVRPKDISVGERNIIGLCYFFTDILQKKNRDTAYSDEYLLVIDDPVSSFDLENKIGILSFLKYQLGLFLLGNINTRALILTHDLLTAIDFEKILEELKNEYKKKFNGQKEFKYAPYELVEKDTKLFVNSRNEYTELMKLVYKYANGEASDQDAYIGNIIRQVLEAFSTFEFKQSIEGVSTDDSILSVMEHEEDRKYYKNLMYRIVLNGGSHRYDQTRGMHVDFFSVISEQEKIRTAKEILCFIYLLNHPHVRAHLGEDECKTIESWCHDIRAK